MTIFILAFKYLDKNEDNQNTGVSSTYFNCTAMDIGHCNKKIAGFVNK